MPPRRVAALAQALTMILILLPGLQPGDPARVQAAIAQPEREAMTVFDATGTGIGCQAGTRKFKGPREPKHPPWPPGAKPTPSPSPSPSPSAMPSGAPIVQPAASAEPLANAPMMLLARTGSRVAQADAAVDPSTAPDVEPDAEIVPDVTPVPRKDKRPKLISGIDVSHHNGDIDYERVLAAGNRFVFIKATQDADFIDPMFPTNMARARAAGVAAGAYHFFDYSLDGKAQADHFVDRLEAGNGLNGALPPVVDVECWGAIGSSTHVVSAARLRDFVARVYERTGRIPIVYTSVFMWKQVVGNAEGFERLPLWAACWGCESPPSLAPGWDDWTFWQTGINRVPGVGRLDGNYFSGSRKELNRLKLRPMTIEGGADVTGKLTVDIDLGGRDARQIRSSPDGESWSKWSPVRNRARAQLSPEEGEQMLHVQLRAGQNMRSPVITDSITLDQTGPEVSNLEVALRVGPIGSAAASVPISVGWTARDTLAGLSDATVSVSCGDGQIQRSEAPGSAAPDEAAQWLAEADIFPEATCTVTAIARDGVGNNSRASMPGVEVSVQPATGDTPSVAVAGDEVGVIAVRGPAAGQATVLIDGESVDTIDLFAPEPTGPEVVYVAPLGGGTQHTLAVEATGSSSSASAGTDAQIDGFVTLARGLEPAA